eukprot:gene7605-5365_t
MQLSELMPQPQPLRLGRQLMRWLRRGQYALSHSRRCAGSSLHPGAAPATASTSGSSLIRRSSSYASTASDRARYTEAYLRQQHAKTILFLALVRLHRQLQQQQQQQHGAHVPGASYGGKAVMAVVAPSPACTSRLVRLAFASSTSATLQTPGLTPAFLASPAAAVLAAKTPSSGNGGSQGTRGTSIFLTAKALEILRSETDGLVGLAPPPHPQQEQEQQWRLFAAVFGAALDYDSLPSHTSGALFLREGRGPPLRLPHGAVRSAATDIPHRFVVVHHHVLTAALLALSEPPFLQSRLAVALTPLQCLQDSFLALCRCPPEGKGNGDAAFLKGWNGVMAKMGGDSTGDGSSPPTPLLPRLQLVLLQLHLLSTLSKELEGADAAAAASFLSGSAANAKSEEEEEKEVQARQQQRGLLRSMLAQVVLQDAHTIVYTTTTTVTTDFSSEPTERRQQHRKRVAGLPGLLLLAVRRVGAVAAEVEARRGGVVTRHDALALGDFEKEARQTRETLTAIVYEAAALLPALLEVPCREGEGEKAVHTTSGGTPPTAGLLVVRALDEAWRVSAPHIQSYGADTPLAVWWLQSIPPLLHAVAALTEARLETLHRVLHPEEEEEEKVVQARFLAVLAGLGELVQELLAYDRLSYERYLQAQAAAATLNSAACRSPRERQEEEEEEDALRKELQKEKEAAQGRTGALMEGEDGEGTRGTGDGVPLAQLRPATHGKRSLFYKAEQTSGVGEAEAMKNNKKTNDPHEACSSDGAALLHATSDGPFSLAHRHSGSNRLEEEEPDSLHQGPNSPPPLLLPAARGGGGGKKSHRFLHRRRGGQEEVERLLSEELDKFDGTQSSSSPSSSGKVARYAAARTSGGDGVLFRLFGYRSETTTAALLRHFALDAQNRELVMEDAWLGLTLGLHRLAHTLRSSRPPTAIPSRAALQHECLAAAFSAFPLQLFESGHRLSQSLSAVLLELEARGAAAAEAAAAGLSSSAAALLSGSGASPSLSAVAAVMTPSRRRELQRWRTFLQLTLQVGADLLFGHTTRAENLLHVWALRSHSQGGVGGGEVDSVQHGMPQTTSAYLAVPVMRDHQRASITRNFAALAPSASTSGLDPQPLPNLPPQELDVHLSAGAAWDTLGCLSHVVPSVQDTAAAPAVIASSPFARLALVNLLLAQMKRLAIVTHRLRRRQSRQQQAMEGGEVQGGSSCGKSKSTAFTTAEGPALFAALLSVLERDMELLLLCGTSAAFLDELCEAHLRLGLDRQLLVDFGDRVLLPTLLPLLVRALEASAEVAHQQQQAGTTVHVGALAHGEDCESALFLLAELSRLAVTPETVAAVLRHRWNDLLQRLSVYCLQHAYRGGLRRTTATAVVSTLPSVPHVVGEAVQQQHEHQALVRETVCRLMGYPSVAAHRHGDEREREVARLVEGLAARALLRVGEVNNGLQLRSRLVRLVGQGWGAGAGAGAAPLDSSASGSSSSGAAPGAADATVSERGLNQQAAAVRAGLEAYQHALHRVSYRLVGRTLAAALGYSTSTSTPPLQGEKEKSNSAEVMLRGQQAALQQWWVDADAPRRAAAQHRPFFAGQPYQAYVMGYLVRFTEHYLREAERRITRGASADLLRNALTTTTTSSSRGGGGGEEEAEAQLVVVTDAMRAAMHDTPALLLDLLGHLTAGGNWAMVYWTLNAADIALRISSTGGGGGGGRQRSAGPTAAKSSSSSSEVVSASGSPQSSTGGEMIKEVAVTAILSQLRVLPPPVLPSGAPLTFGASSFPINITTPTFASVVSVILPSNFSRCWATLSDALADGSETLLRFPRRSHLYGLLREPSAEQVRIVAFALKQATLHLESAVTPFTHPAIILKGIEEQREAKQQQLAQKEKEKDHSSEEAEEEEEEGKRGMDAPLEEKSGRSVLRDGDAHPVEEEEVVVEVEVVLQRLQEQLACFYFSTDAIAAATGTAQHVPNKNNIPKKKKEEEEGGEKEGELLERRRPLGVAPSQRDLRHLLASIACGLDAAVQWAVQQRAYRSRLEAGVRRVVSRCVVCIVERCFVPVVEATATAIAEAKAKAKATGCEKEEEEEDNVPLRLVEDRSAVLWSGLCCAAVLSKGASQLAPELDGELYTALQRSLTRLLQALDTLLLRPDGETAATYLTAAAAAAAGAGGNGEHHHHQQPLSPTSSPDGDPPLSMRLLDMVRSGMAGFVRESDISRRCLLRVGVDTFVDLEPSVAVVSSQPPMEQTGQRSSPKSVQRWKKSTTTPSSTSDTDGNEGGGGGGEKEALVATPSRIFPIHLLTVLSGLWAVCQATVTHPEAARFLYTRVWAPIKVAPAAAASPLSPTSNPVTCCLVPSTPQLEDALDRFAVLPPLCLPAAVPPTASRVAKKKKRGASTEVAAPEPAPTVKVTWAPDTSGWVRCAREVSMADLVAMAKRHLLACSTSCGAHRSSPPSDASMEWLLATGEPGLEGGGDEEAAAGSSSASRQNYLYLRLAKSSAFEGGGAAAPAQPLELVEVEEAMELEQLLGEEEGVGVRAATGEPMHPLTTADVDKVELQGRQLQQLYNQLQAMDAVAAGHQDDNHEEEGGVDPVGHEKKEPFAAPLQRLQEPTRLFLENIVLLSAHLPMHEVLLPAATGGVTEQLQPRRILSTVITLHNLVQRQKVPPRSASVVPLGAPPQQLALLLERVWAVLAAQWRRQFLDGAEGHTEWFQERLATLLQHVKAFRLSDAPSPSGGGGGSGGGGRRRQRDMLSPEPEELLTLFNTGTGAREGVKAAAGASGSRSGLLTAAAFRVVSGRITAEAAEAPRHDDVRRVVIAAALEKAKQRTKGGSGGREAAAKAKTEAALAAQQALAQCLRPPMRRCDDPEEGVEEDEDRSFPELSLVALLGILRVLSRAHQPAAAPQLTALAQAVVAHVAQRYVLLRPRLDGNSLNVSWALWGPDGAMRYHRDTTRAGRAAAAQRLVFTSRCEALYSFFDLPPPQARGGGAEGGGSSAFLFFPPRQRRLLSAMIALQYPNSSSSKKNNNKDHPASSTELDGGAWLYDYMRDNAAYLRCLTALVSAMCHFQLFDSGNDPVAAGTGAPLLDQQQSASLLSYRERQTDPQLVQTTCLLEHILLHWLNVVSNLLRHADTLCHLLLDVGGRNVNVKIAERREQSEEDLDAQRRLLMARVPLVEEIRRLAGGAFQEALLPIVAAAEQFGRAVPCLPLVLQTVFAACTGDSLLPSLQRHNSGSASGQSSTAAGGTGTPSTAAHVHFEWLRGDDVWAYAALHYVTGSPAVMAALSSPTFVAQLSSSSLRVLSTSPAAPNAVAAALSLQVLHQPPPSAPLAPLLRCVTSLLSATIYPSWATRFPSVRLLCQTLVQQLVQRPEYRAALDPHGSSAGSPTGSGGVGGPSGHSSGSPLVVPVAGAAVSNEDLLLFLAVVARADVQVPPPPLAALLHFVMGIRPDVFGQPPVPSHQSRRSIVQARDAVGQAAINSRRTLRHGNAKDVAILDQEDELLLSNFSPDRSSDTAAASHAHTLAHLQLRLPAVMELGMHLDSMRRLSAEEFRRAMGAIGAADDARRERVAALLFPPSTGAAARPAAEVSSTALVAAARLEVAAHLPKDDVGASLGVALLHLRFALRKAMHWAVRQSAPSYPPALLADVVELMGVVEGVAPSSGSGTGFGTRQPFVRSTMSETVARHSSSSSSSLQNQAPASHNNSNNSTRRAWWHTAAVMDNMLSGTLRVLAACASSRAEDLERAVGQQQQQQQQTRTMTTTATLVLTAAERRRISRLLVTTRRRRQQEQLRSRQQGFGTAAGDEAYSRLLCLGLFPSHITHTHTYSQYIHTSFLFPSLSLPP